MGDVTGAISAIDVRDRLLPRTHTFEKVFNMEVSPVRACYFLAFHAIAFESRFPSDCAGAGSYFEFGVNLKAQAVGKERTIRAVESFAMRTVVFAFCLVVGFAGCAAS